jgi:SAM-dependent methyltransferase
LIFLPGLNRQIDFLIRNSAQALESILVIGSSSEQLALKLAQKFGCNVELIVNDYESLMNSKLILSGEDSINLRLMNYDSTDFVEHQFDLIYAQASISITNRNKIVKELKRVLKPQGLLCAGELTMLKKEPPQFVKDIFDSSDLSPIYTEDLERYYVERNFILIAREDLSSTLEAYYSTSGSQLKSTKEKLSEHEQRFYKKLINKISHESNAYLKLGGDKHIGFEALLLRNYKK